MAGESKLLAEIERFETARAELRETISAAHAATKDLRSAIREARDVKKLVDEAARGTVEERIAAEVDTQLRALGEKTKTAMAASVEKVNGEFAKLTNLSLYGNEQGRGEPVFDTFRRTIEALENKIDQLEKRARRIDAGIDR